ncbi:MAG: PspC domain-containing protein [Aliifodinibius sp.]|nr:PspC domain-containing protein [Fodinibius sp.]
MKKLYRSQTNSMIFGVCGGLGQYFGIDPTIVRLAFVFLAFYHMLGVWVYLVLAILLPTAPEGYQARSSSVNFEQTTQTTKVIGGGLILLGILALFSTFSISWFSWMRLENMWPALIILFGVLLLARAYISEE